MGLADIDSSKPFTDIANLLLRSCQALFFWNKGAEAIKDKIGYNGCAYFEFNTIAMGHDGMPYFVVEKKSYCQIPLKVNEWHNLDAMIAIFNCDRIVPGMIIGILWVKHFYAFYA